MEKIPCTKCGDEMPLLRKTRYGYSFCIGCSTVDRVGGAPVNNHKTGNTIQILPRELADKIIIAGSRKGYGIMSGLKK